MVTGAAGTLAIAILSDRGFQVTPPTKQPERADDLTRLRRERDHRALKSSRTRETTGKRAFAGCCRFRRHALAEQRARDAALRRGGGDLWMGSRHGFADSARTIYSTQCFAARDRVEHVSDCRSANAWGASGVRA